MKFSNEAINIETLREKYIQKLPNGKFRVEIEIGYNDVGKRERFVKRCSNLCEAISVRNTIIEKMNDGKITANANLTFETLTKKFFVSSKKTRAETTIQNYKKDLNNYILPYIGQIQIKDITKEHLEQLYKYLKENYETKKKIGLSDVTIGHVHATIKLLLNYAIKESYIKDNVAMKLENAPNIEDTKEKEIYTNEEVKEIYKAIKKENLRFQSIVEVALTGCLRRGEIAGLNWSDIDTENKRVLVNKSIGVITGKGLVEKPPKTKKSKSSVCISQSAINTLAKYKEELEQYGFEITNDTPVFLSVNGKRLSPDKISTIWEDFVNRNDIPKHCFHTLRHTGLSIMYEQSGNIVAVSKHARHSRVSTTENIYLHSSKEIDEEMAEFVDNIRTGIDIKGKNEKEIINKLNETIHLLQLNNTNK